MSRLNSISDNNQDHGPYKWRNGQNVTYKYWAARGNNPANTAHKQDCAYVVSSKNIILMKNLENTDLIIFCRCSDI